MDNDFIYEEEQEDEVPDDLFADLTQDSNLWDIKLAAYSGLLLVALNLISYFFLFGFDLQGAFMYARPIPATTLWILLLSLALYFSKNRLVAVLLFMLVLVERITVVVVSFWSLFFMFNLLVTGVVFYFMKKGITAAFDNADY